MIYGYFFIIDIYKKAKYKSKASFLSRLYVANSF